MKVHYLAAAAVLVATPAFAKDAAETPLTKCEASLGSIAVVDGDAQGWTAYGLPSPRELINAMAANSGCFTIATAGAPADFLMNAVAGSQEEVNKSVDVAKTAITEGIVRSGVLASAGRSIPMVGGMLGMFGGMGGKKKTYAAGLKVISPATGMAIISGSGVAKSSSMTFAGWGGVGGLGGYGSSKDGKMLSGAFIQAFNSIAAQGSALSAARRTMLASAAATSSAVAAVSVYSTAVDTKMFAAASSTGTPLRSLRAGTTITPTGKRQGLFVEVKDNFGTTGWVSVEDLK